MHFNPRAPCGARQRPSLSLTVWQLFQSTRPMRGATGIFPRAINDFRFQSTRPMRGATPRQSRRPWKHGFQSTRPMRGATQTVFFLGTSKKFQSTRPMRGATAKVNKLLCTFLQKRHGFQIFLRKTLPFKAFCRLQIGKNFSICGANRCGNFCELLLRTIRSSVLPEGRSACSQNAQFYSHTFSRDNRNADCLFPDP